MADQHSTPPPTSEHEAPAERDGSSVAEPVIGARSQVGAWWKWALGLAISAALIGALVWLADPTEVAATMAQAQFEWIGVGVVAFLGTNAMRWWRLWALLPQERRPWLATLGVVAGHSSLNNLLPMRTGELVFPLLLRRATGQPIANGLLLLVTIRIVELAVLAPLYTAALSIWAASADIALGPAETVLWVFAALALGVVLVLPWGLGQGLRLGDALLGRVAWVHPARVEKVRAKLSQGHDVLDRLGPRGVASLAVTTTLMWGTQFGVFYACMLAFGIDISFAQAMVGSGGGILSNLLPVNGLGSFGTLEAGWAAGLVATGVDASPAIASGLAMHLLVTCVAGVLAVLGAVPMWRAPFKAPEARRDS